MLAVTLTLLLTLAFSSISVHAAAAEYEPIDENNPVISVVYVRKSPEDKTAPFDQMTASGKKGDVPEGQVEIGGSIYDLGTTYTITSGECSYEGHYIASDALYDLHIIEEYTPVAVRDEETGTYYKAGRFAYSLELVRITDTLPENAKVDTVHHAAAEKKFVERYTINDKEVSRDEYAEKKSRAYRENTSTKYDKDLKESFTGSEMTFIGIDEQILQNTGSVIYKFRRDEYYSVDQQYIRTHALYVNEASQEDKSASHQASGDKTAEKTSATVTEKTQEEQSYRTTRQTTIVTENTYAEQYDNKYVVNGKDVSREDYDKKKKGSRKWSEKTTASLKNTSEPVLKDEDTRLVDVTFTSPDGTARAVRTDSEGNLLEKISGKGILCYNYEITQVYTITHVYEKVHALTVSDKAASKTKLKVRAKIKSVKAGKKTVTVKLAKLSRKNLKKVSGYQIQISTKKSFKNARTIKSGKKTVTKKIKRLKRKKTYYIRARAIKGSTRGPWSTVKKIRTK